MRHLLLIIFIILTNTAAAGNKSNLKAVYLMKGECQTLVVSGTELPCSGQMMQSEYDDGKLGFYFLPTDADFILTFSGFGPDQIKWGPNSIEQPIRRLIKSEKSFCLL